MLYDDLNGKEIQKRGDIMWTCGWLALLYSRNWHSSIKQLYSNGQKETLARYPKWKANFLNSSHVLFLHYPAKCCYPTLQRTTKIHLTSLGLCKSGMQMNVLLPHQTHLSFPKSKLTDYLSSDLRGLSEVYLRDLTWMQAVFRQYSKKKLFCYQLVIYCMIISSLNFS